MNLRNVYINHIHMKSIFEYCVERAFEQPTHKHRSPITINQIEISVEIFEHMLNT